MGIYIESVVIEDSFVYQPSPVYQWIHSISTPVLHTLTTEACHVSDTIPISSEELSSVAGFYVANLHVDR